MDNNQMFDTNNNQPEVYAPMDAQPVEAAPQYDAQPQYNAAPQYDTQAQYQQPQYAQPQYAAPQYAAPQPAKKKLIGLSIASLVLGILSLLACCYCGALFGIPGAICGAIAMAKKADGKGMAIAGLICSILGVLLCIITWVLIGIGAVEMSNMGYDYYYYY